MQDEARQQLKQVTCINIDVHLWSGRAKLRADDIHMIQGELPPADLASLGSKKICNPEALAVFTAIKKRAHRLCEERGIRFLGGYAVPKLSVKELIKELRGLSAEFTKELTDFLATYDQEIDDWVTKHPGWEASIRKAVEPSAEVARRMSFDFQPFDIVPVRADKAEKDTEQAETAVGRLGRAAGRMSDQLFHEVSQAARELFEKSLMGRDEVTQRALRPIRALRGKLDGLSFLDSRVTPLVKSIDSVLAAMPQEGKISGAQLSALHGTVFMLSDVNRLKQHGEAVLKGDVRETDLFAEAAEQQAELQATAEAQVPAEPAVEEVQLQAKREAEAAEPVAAKPQRAKERKGEASAPSVLPAETPAPAPGISIPVPREQTRRTSVAVGVTF